MSQKILVVDDEKSILDIIAFNLKKENFEIVSAMDGEEGYEKFETESPDLILLDIMMPKMDGIEVCKKIREKSNVPIIMLTAKAEEVDKVLGLELGADDYVTKPFSVRELMARVKANLRKKSNEAAEIVSDNLSVEDIFIDFKRFELRKRDELIELTPREFDVIKFLITQREQVFSREILLEKVWGYEYFGDVRTVDVTIRRIRAKIEDNPEKPKYVLTKRGVGYYFGV